MGVQTPPDDGGGGGSGDQREFRGRLSPKRARARSKRKHDERGSLSEVFGKSSREVVERLVKLDELGAPAAVPAVNLSDIKLRREQDILQHFVDQELAQIGLEDLWVVVSEILYAGREVRCNYSSPFHAPICNKLQHLAPGENLLLLVPREHRKTHLLLAYAAWLITRDPNIRIQFVSLNEDRRKKLSAFMRDIFRRGVGRFGKYQGIYSHMVIDTRRELLQAHQFTHPLRTTGLIDPTIFSTYLGGGTGGRADVMIMDDPWDHRTLGADPARESFLGEEHLQKIQEEAMTIVSAALSAAGV